jgi:hypothetical protein
MSLRWLHAVFFACVAAGCGSQQTTSDEPTTANERQRRDLKARGERSSEERRWSGWRYQGDRDDCFFVIGRRCFKTEQAACAAATCTPPTKCTVEGGGPASIVCK